MTTKLVNFKTFLEKAKKPCSKPGEHRHLGYDYCHPITSVHHKHNNLGLNAHHGMDEFGQIPTGTIPPNWEDDHHLAKPHGEKTGSTGGNCNPVEYPKGSGKIVPAHRHTGADYCHPITQKHGASAPDGAAWHNTHQAEIDESWQLFNDQQGLEYTADYSAETGFPAEGADPLQTDYVPYLEDDAPTFKDILPNLQVGSTINYYGSNLEVLKVSDYSVVASAEQGVLYDFGPSDFQQNDPNISVVDAEPEVPTGDVINEINPHELQVGTTVSYSTPSASGDALITDIKITAISDDNVQFTTLSELGDGGGWDGEKSLESFNKWVTDTLTNEGDATIQHPGLNDIPNPQSPPIPTGTIDDPYTEEYLNTLPKIGESVSDVNTLASFPPGTQFMAENGLVITLLAVQQGLNAAGNEAVTNYHVDMGDLGEQWFNGYQWPAGFGSEGSYEPTVLTLPAGVTEAMDKGFELGGKVHKGGLNSLPVGLSFTAGSKTITVTENWYVEEQAYAFGPGEALSVSVTGEDGTTFTDVELKSNPAILDEIFNDGKIVGLPSGVTSQLQASEKAPNFNKHGLDKGTKVDVKNWGGEVNNGTITYVHKTKTGQNYTIEWDDAYGHKTIKVKSSNFEDPESDSSSKMGYFVTDAVHKKGMEPSSLTVGGSMFAEPGNWDKLDTNAEVQEGGKTLSGKLGSNPGTLAKDAAGNISYLKQANKIGGEEQLYSEALANSLYNLLGIETVPMEIGTFDDKVALKSQWINGLETLTWDEMSQESSIMDSFVADAWLGNWDVLGMEMDNTKKLPGGGTIKVDQGGALHFRAKGEDKSTMQAGGFNEVVQELTNLRDPNKAKEASQVFKNVTPENLEKGAQILNQVTDAHIDSLVDQSGISNKEKMKEILKARRDNIVGQLLGADAAGTSSAPTHHGQHKHSTYGWHDQNQKHTSEQANLDHKEMKLPYVEYRGTTSVTDEEATAGNPSTNMWTQLQNSGNFSPEIKAIAKAAQTYDFKGGVNFTATDRMQAVRNFLKENKITDPSTSGTSTGDMEWAFADWQAQGGDAAPSGNIRIRAALFTLKGQQQAKRGSERGFWNTVMGNKGKPTFNKNWDIGVAGAAALIPYIAASQQFRGEQLKAEGKTTLHVERGLRNGSSNPVADRIKATLGELGQGSELQGEIIAAEFLMPSDGISGWAVRAPKGEKENITAKEFGSGGVVFEKRDLNLQDVLIDFNAFSHKHKGEREVLIDSDAVDYFSYDEVRAYSGGKQMTPEQVKQFYKDHSELASQL